MIFGTTGLTNFAHGELVTFGALIAYFFNRVSGLPFLVAGAVRRWSRPASSAGCSTSACGDSCAAVARASSRMLVVSIGLSLFLRYIFLFFFGGRTRPYDEYQAQTGISIGPVDHDPARPLGDHALSVLTIMASASPCSGPASARPPARSRTTPAWPPPRASTSSASSRYVWVAGTALAGLAGIFLA